MKIEIKVIDVDKDDIISILSGFNSYSDYWCALLDWVNDNYNAARKSLLTKMNEKDICKEDVWAEILLQGNSLLITDDEDQVHILTLENLIAGINLAFKNGFLDQNPENWDSSDCDIIIQCAIFKEVIYG